MSIREISVNKVPRYLKRGYRKEETATNNGRKAIILSKHYSACGQVKLFFLALVKTIGMVGIFVLLSKKTQDQWRAVITSKIIVKPVQKKSGSLAIKSSKVETRKSERKKSQPKPYIGTSFIRGTAKDKLDKLKGYIEAYVNGRPHFIGNLQFAHPFDKEELLKVVALLERRPSYKELAKELAAVNAAPKLLHLLLVCGIADRYKSEQQFKLWKTVAREDNYTAILKVANYYFERASLDEKNVHKAIDWYEKATKLAEETGYSYQILGEIYLFGKGVNKDVGMARYWYEKALKKRLKIELRDELGHSRGPLNRIEDFDKFHK